MRRIVISLSFLVFFPFLAHAETAMERVNRSGTIRCGYVEYAPALTRDVATNKWGGYDYEILKAVSERLELKADYTASTGWATVVPDLNSKKFDMLCVGFWVHPNVAKFALFSRPFIYQPVFVIARVNDKKVNASTVLNDPKLTMVALDGDNPVAIAHADFPQAHILTLPNLTDFSQVLVNVADGKADFTIVDAETFGVYDKSNPGKLKILTPEKPIRVYPVSFAFGSGDYALREAINGALDEMILDGSIDKIMDAYDKYPHAYYRATIMYKNPYKK